MRAKLLIVGLCVVALGWPAVAGAQTTTTSVPDTTTTTVPVSSPPPVVTPPPAPTGPTAAQIAAFLRALIPANSGAGKRIVYSVSGERVWLIDNGEQLVRTYKVSGRRGEPNPGVYHVYSKSVNAASGSARMHLMVRFAHGRNLAIGFHTIPTIRGKPMQSIGQLGSYQSHGCVRQDLPDAFYLWLFAPVGTTVVVLR